MTTLQILAAAWLPYSRAPIGKPVARAQVAEEMTAEGEAGDTGDDAIVGPAVPEP